MFSFFHGQRWAFQLEIYIYILIFQTVNSASLKQSKVQLQNKIKKIIIFKEIYQFL